MKTSVLLARVVCLIVVFFLPAAAPAATLLLDFGPTVTLAADATKDPAHAIGLVPLTETTWNTITADTNTLYQADGALASGVTLDLGRSTAGVDTIHFSDNGFSVSALGGSVNGGALYSGTSPVKDGIFGGSGGANNLAVGLRVNGLATGTYTIFVHGRNTSTAVTASLRWYATNGPSASTYNFSLNDATAFVANASPANTNSFIEGDNFGVLTVTLASGDSLYVACEGTVAAEMRGFINAITIYAGVPVLPAKLTSQPAPATKTVYEGVTVSFIAGVSGTPPLTNQWYFNDTNALADGGHVTGAKSNVLTLRAVTTDMSGIYRLAVTNAGGDDLSSNATLTVNTLLNTAQMTNLWSLSPGERPYLGTGGTERGLAFNPLTTNLLLVSRLSADPDVIVLDALTGAERHHLNTAGIPTSVAGSTLGLNTIGVDDDGAVYGAAVTVSASSPAFYMYRWSDDSPGDPPVMIFAGDPAWAVQPNLRWTDSMVVRGTGADTQILISPGSGTNVALLRTSSGYDFQTEIPPAIIAVSGVPSGFARHGLAWGPGTNTFWAKTSGGQLYLIQFDLETSTGTVLHAYATTLVPGGVRGLGTDPSRKFLAGVMLDSLGDNVRLYDVSDLEFGPVLRDQEAFATQNANMQGTAALTFGANYLFALDSDNGIKAFVMDTNYVPPSISILLHPTDQTFMEGATVTFNTVVAGDQPMLMQWRFNGTNDLADGPNVSGSHTNALTLRNLTMNSAGAYSLFVSNAFDRATSSNALLTVLPTYNTAQMSNIWNLLAGDRAYLGTDNTERGLAFNSATTNLLLASRASADPAVVVLDPATGAEKHFLDVSGIPGTVPNVSVGLSTIGVADDGAVFGASVAVNTGTTPLYIYRWPDDSPGNPPATVFTGDPAATVQPNLRWTDSLAVRGAGADTQILISPAGGTNVALLRTPDGSDFQNGIPPAIIAVSGVPSGFARLGLAWGPGTNTFWAKQPNQALYLIQFDLNTHSGYVLYSFGTNYVPNSVRAISTDKNQQFLAGLALETSDNVRLYDISDLSASPVLRDQEVFATHNPNTTIGGAGATAIGGGYVFALDSNNGIKAFLINSAYLPPLGAFPITSIAPSDGSVVLTWQSVAGHSYQVQARDTLETGIWGDLGSPIVASGPTSSFTNAISPTPRFYRVTGW